MRRRGPATARMSSTVSEVWVRCTASAPTARATSTRSFTISGAPCSRVDLPDLPAERGQVAGAEVLLANLHGRQPGRQALRHHRDQISPARLRAVGDQAEAQLVQSGRPSSGEDAVA